MSGTNLEYRGGDIRLSAEKSTGLPLLKPLYGPPPYQYTDDVVFMIVYEADEAAIREVLPTELEPLPGNIVAMCFFLCPDVTGWERTISRCLAFRFATEITPDSSFRTSTPARTRALHATARVRVGRRCWARLS